MSTLSILKAAQQNAKILPLKDGRKLFFNEFGATNGFPIIHFHGHGTCRLEGALFDSVAKETGFRIISQSRPGTELSTEDRNFSFKSHSEDTRQLMEYLNITRCGVTGWSGGGPFVLSTCHYLGVRSSDWNIAFGGLMGSFAPLSEDTFNAMSARDRWITSLTRKYSDVIIRRLLSLIWYFAMKQPALLMKYLMTSISVEDRTVFETIPDAKDLFLLMIHQTVNHNTTGLGEELKQQLAAEWMFDIGDVSEHIPMFIFQGKTDTFVPVEIGEELERTLKHAEAHYFDQGHMFPMDPLYQRIVFEKFKKVIV